MRSLEEFISKLGDVFKDELSKEKGFCKGEVLTHLYNLITSVTEHGSDLKNTFILYAVKNNPNKKESELFKHNFVKVRF